MMFYITFSVSLRLPPFPQRGKGIFAFRFPPSAFCLVTSSPRHDSHAFALSAFCLRAFCFLLSPVTLFSFFVKK
jgi:hypothetical protein